MTYRITFDMAEVLKSQLIKLFTNDDFLNEVVQVILKRISTIPSVPLQLVHESKSCVTNKSFISFTDISKPEHSFYFQRAEIEQTFDKAAINMKIWRSHPRSMPFLKVEFRDDDVKVIEEIKYCLRVHGIDTIFESDRSLACFSFTANTKYASKWWKMIRKDNLFLGHAESVAQEVDKLFSLIG
jgi:hypothetical protein